MNRKHNVYKTVVVGGGGNNDINNNDLKEVEKCKNLIEKCSKQHNLKVLGWREVPVNPNNIGILAREVMPSIQQIFVATNNKNQINNLEQRLYALRKSWVYR